MSSLLDETIEAVAAGLSSAVYQRPVTPRAAAKRRRRVGKPGCGGSTAGRASVSLGSSRPHATCSPPTSLTRRAASRSASWCLHITEIRHRRCVGRAGLVRPGLLTIHRRPPARASGRLGRPQLGWGEALCRPRWQNGRFPPDAAVHQEAPGSGPCSVGAIELTNSRASCLFLCSFW